MFGGIGRGEVMVVWGEGVAEAKNVPSGKIAQSVFVVT